MRRHLLTSALALSFGVLMMASDASACCHKKKAACPAPVACAPVECAPAPKKHCFKMPKFKKGGLCHKKQAVACETVAYAPACETYAAPQAYYAAPQAAYAAPQEAMPMPQAPTK